MTLRITKVILVLGVAILYSLVVFNNVTDYNSNYQFVRHVMLMDTTYPGNNGMWRSISSPSIHTAFYLFIIAWEIVTTLLCLWGGARMAQAVRDSTTAFQQSKRVSIAALTIGILMWLVAFQGVGGEWFLMWQSKTWNGQADAFRMFTVVAVVLLIVAQPDSADQP